LEQGRTLTDPKQRADVYRKLNEAVTRLDAAVFTYDSAVVVARQDYVHAPSLDDPGKAIPILAGNYQFHDLEVMNYGVPRFAPALKFLLPRLRLGLLVVVGVSVLIFALARVMPGDPARLALGPAANAEQVTAMRERLGLDRPVLVQYGIFVL